MALDFHAFRHFSVPFHFPLGKAPNSWPDQDCGNQGNGAATEVDHSRPGKVQIGSSELARLIGRKPMGHPPGRSPSPMSQDGIAESCKNGELLII